MNTIALRKKKINQYLTNIVRGPHYKSLGRVLSARIFGAKRMRPKSERNKRSSVTY